MTTEEAWRRYRQCHDPAARQFLVTTYTPLIQFVLKQVHIPLSPTLEIEDAISYGLIGLLDAIKKYDPGRGCKFETYAVPRIQGAIKDGIRRDRWLPRSIQEQRSSVERATEDLERQLDRPPTPTEVAQNLGMTLDTYCALIDEIGPVTVLSLDDIVFESPAGEPITIEETVADPRAILPHEYTDRQEMKKLIAEAIERLPEREKLVFTLRIYEELRFQEIGQVMEISGSRACQLFTQAFDRLRKQLDVPKPPPGRAGRPCQATVDKPNNIYYSGGGSSSRTIETKGGERMAKPVVVDKGTRAVYDLLKKLSSREPDGLFVTGPDEILAATKLDPHAIEILTRQGALERVGADKWRVIEGVEFQLVESLPEEFLRPSGPEPQETFESPKDEPRKEEESVMAEKEIMTVKLGPALIKSCEAIRANAEASTDFGLVITSGRLADLGVKSWHVTDLKRKGLIEPVGRDERDKRKTIWRVHQVAVEEIGGPVGVPTEAVAEEPTPAPAAPARQPRPPMAEKPVKKRSLEKPKQPVAKPAKKPEEKRPISVEEALFQKLILADGQLRSAEELRATAATLDKVARLAENIAENPEAYQTFLELYKQLA